MAWPTPRIATSVIPQTVYPKQFTREAGNLAAMLGVASTPALRQQTWRPFQSWQAPAWQYRVGTLAGQQAAQGAYAPMQVQQAHQFANLKNLLEGFGARQQEALGWAGLAAQQYQNALAQQLARGGALLRLLQVLGRGW